ncbi:DUF2252 family protein [Rhodobacter sp. CZR27]|uniref:DUF2252 family protein n=1 Tax=Rhodobacter sp. CZR27 TaxID=2033869 RepID=UPI000BBE651F|nr:DUF2252 family protein [Rhodobacter sp. CZR27]
MTEETDPLSDGIARALSAASAANDAAQDLDQLQAEHRAFVERITLGQRRMQAMSLGILAGAGVAVLLGGLVYFRSVADLREAAEVQAAAGELMISRLTELGEVIGKVEALSGKLETLEADLKGSIDGVGERIAGDLEGFAQQAAAVEPQFASAIQNHVDQSLAGTRDALLAALGEVDGSLRKAIEAGAGSSPELRSLMEELKAGRRVAAPAPAPARAVAQPARPARKPVAQPAPKPADNPIRFP